MILLGGCLLYWFSLVDIMDGNRARRLKVGSPLGRIIDEGGDTITMANYSVFIAYVWGFTNPAFEVLYLALNFVFYAMEMRNKITGNLVMNVGELSPCELELMFSISLILSGIFGTEFLGKTPGDYLGIPPGSKCPLHVVCEYQLRDIWGCFLFLVAIALLGDSLQDSLKHSVKKTIYFYVPVLFCLGIFFAMTQLPCYTTQKGLTLLMVNYVLSSIVLNLMVHNMTEKPFSIFQPTLLLLLLPFAAHYAKVGADLEAMVTVFVTAAGFFIFMSKMIILSI